eukprot:31210-Pelagococcus_subviridis.AAC.5
MPCYVSRRGPSSLARDGSRSPPPHIFAYFARFGRFRLAVTSSARSLIRSARHTATMSIKSISRWFTFRRTLSAATPVLLSLSDGPPRSCA